MTEQPTTLRVCQHQAKNAATRAAAWSEATDLFSHNVAVAARFADEAVKAARLAMTAANLAATLAVNAEGRTRADAQRTQDYADVAASAATHAKASAHAARPFVPQAGDLAALCRVRQEAHFAWLACPDGSDYTVKLAVLRARVEEAEAAVRAALPVPALA